MTDSRDGEYSGLALFAKQLQAARVKAGMTREDLAARINFSASLIKKIESRERVPSPEFAKRCDEVFDMPETFVLLQPGAHSPLPAWFRAYADAEAVAAVLRSWQPMIVDGLLQTEDYARALLSAHVGVVQSEVDQQVAARMERQAILERDNPPLLWALLDEAVLQRPVGGREVMRQQIEHLAEMAQRPNVVLQVIPAEVGAHDGVNGSFVIVEFSDAPTLVYLETALTGWTVEQRDQVETLRAVYDGLRAEALPRAATEQRVKEAAKLWT